MVIIKHLLSILKVVVVDIVKLVPEWIIIDVKRILIWMAKIAWLDSLVLKGDGNERSDIKNNDC